MKLFIPELGTKLKLTTAWEFTLYAESRNDTLGHIEGYDLEYRPKRDGSDYNALDFHKWVKQDDRSKVLAILPIKLKKGTELVVDRIYIRKGAKDFSSISFYIKGLKKVTTNKLNNWHFPKARPVRFWARLDDCNKINFNLVD